MKHARKSAGISVFLLLAIALPGPAFGQDPPKLTFSHQIRTKLYIGTPIECDSLPHIPPAAPGTYAAKVLAYFTLCQTTDANFQENPIDGRANPVDARITAIVHFRFTCQVGNPIPVDLGQMTVISTTPGLEPLQFSGIINPTTTVNTILADGKWAFVVSGSPSVAGEIPFQAISNRATSAIWHRVTGIITCGVSNGMPTGRNLVYVTQATRFPSHRTYWYTGTGVFQRIGHTLLQNPFKHLWSLPAVPAP